ncbi:MAG: transposase [Blastochloris sp.]|nr:transposase [Blastochloris sp.]
MGRQPRRQPTDDWTVIEALCTFPDQRAYEQLRPVVLFGQSATERAHQVGEVPRTFRRRVTRFRRLGLASVLPPERPPPTPALPPALRDMIGHLKAEHPPLRVNEIATICYMRTGRRPHADTIKRILATTPLPTPQRRFAPYAQIPDPAMRRATVIRRFVEGWNQKSIAAYRQTSRKTVHQTIRRFAADGLAGLYAQSRAPKRPRRKATFDVITRVRRLQRNPRMGAFRVRAALRQEGIQVSLRTCGRVLAQNRAVLQSLTPPVAPRPARPMPFHATRPHQYWSADIRYLDMHQLGSGKIYVVTILDNYSRAILASVLARRQNTATFIAVLHAAIQRYGSPEALVTDGGAVFKADQVRPIYAALHIQKEQIKRRRPWQNYVETTFSVMQRMADDAFVQATSWAALVAVHARWVHDFNTQLHWAHRHRAETDQTPRQVLGAALGTVWDAHDLQQLFQVQRYTRSVDATGYVRFRHWRLYAEYGLHGHYVTVWVTPDHLTRSFADHPLAEYTVQLDEDQHQITTVRDPRLHHSIFHIQPWLWALDDTQWVKALRVPVPVRQTAHTTVIAVDQAALFA